MASNMDGPPEPPPLALSRGHKKRERTREQLVSVGLTLLAEKGDAMTVSDVVSLAKVSNGTFYNYFSDRDELLRALAERSIIDFRDQAVNETASTDPALRIAITAAHLLDRARMDPAWGRTVLRLTNVPRSVRDDLRREFRDELTAGFEQGRFTAPPDAITQDLILGLLALSIRRCAYDELPGDYLQNVVGRALLTLGLAPGDAENISEQARTIALASLPAPPVD